MSTLSGIASNVLERLLFRPVTVVSVECIGERFRLLRMEGEGFRSVRWTAGQAIQIFLGNLTKRTYTPMNLDTNMGSACFLFYLHGDSPGSRWAASVKVGDTCQVTRPQDSLDFASVTVPVLFFGDETSFAAAQTLDRCQSSGGAPRYVFEVESCVQSEVVLNRLGLENVLLITKERDGSHLHPVAAKLAELAAMMSSPLLVLTGQARSIQSIRKRLKQDYSTLPKSKVKAYWSPGKTGMD